MHMRTSASPAERNWAEHERIQMAKHNKLGFAKLAQLVEITSNLKLDSCRQHSGGYVMSWIMDSHEDQRPREATGKDEEDDGPEPAAWGVRAIGTFGDVEQRRQIDVFVCDGTSPSREVSVVYGQREATLLHYDHVPPPAKDATVQDAQAGEVDWTDPENLAPGGTGPKSSGEDEPDTKERLTDARFDPNHHSFVQSQELRRSGRLAGQGGAHSQHLDDIPLGSGLWSLLHTVVISADVVVEEEAGLRTDRAVGESFPRHSPVMEGEVHIGDEDQLSPPRDVEGDISLALIVRPPSTFYTDDGITGCRMDDRPGGSTTTVLDPEELERTKMEDPYNHTSRRSDPRRPTDGFVSPPRWFSRPQARLMIDVEDCLCTSGEEGDLHVPAGARRHGSLSGLDNQIAAERQRLDDLVRERDGLAETEGHRDEADTATKPIDVVGQRERARRAAAAAAARAATTASVGHPDDAPRHEERVTRRRGESAPFASGSDASHHETRARRSGRS
ncbi:hypothetical protein CBR_g39784 [Chara braunii]|uniref:Uncharacterized protein n=1 Tax=Chara braunii TaxID=69332 RepID=A0A388LSA5_CHABU|nr:hypothetical protein CBR_g39784 [Chara braunii]|eukprot:GBG85218.1 hypothetical protein CBR_g39784 [Chara braunii]